MLKPCKLVPVPFSSLKWEALNPLLGKAYEEIGRFDGICQHFSYPEKIFTVMTAQEVIDSLSEQDIEVKLEDILSPQEKVGDIKQLIDYWTALEQAGKYIAKHPFSLAHIRKIHIAILKNARVNRKEVGTYRKIQNWVGVIGRPIEEAHFLPPAPRHLQKHLYNLEKYFHFKEKDPLVHLAILTAQFLSIHAFLDGNGRIGRMLIPLFLYKKKITVKPLFYMSAYFQSDRMLYFNKLFDFSTHQEWEGWIQYFLKGVIEQGRINYLKAEKILSLYHEIIEELCQEIPLPAAKKGATFLFEHPIFNKEHYLKRSTLPKSIKKRILTILEKKHYITLTKQGYKVSRLFSL